MIRRVFTVASAVFLLLCIGTAALWGRSRWFYHSWSCGGPTGTFCELSSGCGRVCIEWGTTAFPIGRFQHSAQPVEAGMAAPWGETNPLGFRLAANRKRFTYALAVVDGQPPAAVSSGTPSLVSQSSLLVVPYWFLCLLLAALAGIAFRLRRRPAAPGHCPTCGYDLRASADRCPECGTPIHIKD